MFRMGNGRDANLINAQINVVTLKRQITKDGLEMQRFIDLELVRSKTPSFLLSWTVIHKLNSQSPFYGLSLEQIKALNSEIFVSLIGYDEVYAQTVHTGHRYTGADFITAIKFKDVLTIKPDGGRKIDFTKFNDVVT